MICIDWDGVLRGKDRLPLPGALEAVEAIVQEGIDVVIFSCVPNREMIIDWLEKYDFPYSDVTNIKPVAELYIDDRGLHHKDWTSTLKEINKRLKTEIEL